MLIKLATIEKIIIVTFSKKLHKVKYQNSLNNAGTGK